MCRELEELYQMGMMDGRAEGRNEGIALGRAEGRSEGIALGRAEGRSEGIALGRAEGRAEGERIAKKEMVFSLAEIELAGGEDRGTGEGQRAAGAGVADGEAGPGQVGMIAL